MKKLVIMFLLLASPALAGDKYLFLWGNETLSASDKSKIVTEIKNVLDDTASIKLADLPRWCLASNTNTIGRVLCVNIKSARNTKYNITLADMDAWKNANLSAPAKLQFITGNGIEVLLDNGLKLINASEPE